MVSSLKFKVFGLGLLLILTMFSCKKDNCKEKTCWINCSCTEEYNPVCGCNNTTYSSPSCAELAGIQNYTQGKCP